MGWDRPTKSYRKDGEDHEQDHDAQGQPRRLRGLPLEDHELDSVSGGFSSVEHVRFSSVEHGAAQSGQNDSAQMFAQLLQQITQGG